MRLRPATSEDAPALARILGDWVRETGWMPVLHTREEDLGFVRLMIEGMEVTVADEGSPLGFLALDGDQVPALQVAPEARGRGIGRALLDHAKSQNRHLALWVFEANARAVAFYEREGFEVARRTDGLHNEEGLPDLRMIWNAAP
ncbi:GNAT family N-acetyltransferase [Rubellimicrobium rubrum]|uniref:GNAT family N-acetyltransferase n=1 Tax=Rubellimicrobium rubrum TaxID=2585369 RepID=A0A5C4MPC0_9RHOB|nr:GNAT family N-acetyltransferase [Rubellimicrobium rubrum]TNC46789.1 GNAT family N-acetyltransferase [Rubellimicrobium rubrum]